MTSVFSHAFGRLNCEELKNVLKLLHIMFSIKKSVSYSVSLSELLQQLICDNSSSCINRDLRAILGHWLVVFMISMAQTLHWQDAGGN